MSYLRPAIPLPSNPWINQVFSARCVLYGGVVKRSIRWIDKEVGREVFINEVKTRGWHLAECNGQYVVFCTDAPVKLHF